MKTNKLNEYNKDLEERQEILNNKKAKLLQDKDELIETILNEVDGHVSCITVDNEPVYED